MRKFIIAIGAVLALAACAAAQPKTPAQAVWEARAAFDGGPLNVAAAYAALPSCPQAQGKPCADRDALRQIAHAEQATLSAFDAAEATVRDNPKTDAETALAGAAHAASALQAIFDIYGIK
jgi:Prokaryotic membrane lipoprotein lipid attachment site